MQIYNIILFIITSQIKYFKTLYIRTLKTIIKNKLNNDLIKVSYINKKILDTTTNTVIILSR